MRQEERTLIPVSAPVDESELVEGAIYFSVRYLDQDRFVPALEVYEFAGREAGQLNFRSMDPVQPEARPSTIFQFDQALEELMACSLRRRGISGYQFEARHVKRFPEPVSADALNGQDTYFSLFFLDQDSLIPGLEPYVFVGRDLDKEALGLYFQDWISYEKGIRFDTTDPEHPARFALASDEDTAFYSFEEALDALIECSMRRRTGGL